ncbi:serine hydrolase domain-containing protein [Ectobacillus ponti]|uniref:Beta-lactamase family protein n=1 Tax=Ectobacillus ponti TaxID=2961894 RepID=A0AA42BRQ4_9BACI|nr:serine hydrolase domain-containing protein [Ectobacillus ponti]MCP8967603.1 beta-lactamase family protein [Ectobacillus ponti]
MKQRTGWAARKYQFLRAGLAGTLLAAGFSVYTPDAAGFESSSFMNRSLLALFQGEQNVYAAPSVSDGVQPVQGNNALAEKIDQLLKANDFNGSALIINKGQTLLDQGYGYANFANRTMNTARTQFYVASLTKTVVATAVLQLQEQGKLKVTDNVHQYVSSFDESRNITISDLLSHTAGIAATGGELDYSSPRSLAMSIGELAPAAEAGTAWAYSDRNYMVLGYIIEQLSGEQLSGYLKKHIFQPAGMGETGTGRIFGYDQFLAKGYTMEDGKNELTSALDFSTLYGCGDMYSTTHNIYLLDKALLSGKLLSEGSVQQMFTPVSEREAAVDSTYGYSFYVDAMYHVQGILSGWDSFNSFTSDGETYVILLSNRRNADAKGDDELNETIKNMLAAAEQLSQ